MGREILAAIMGAVGVVATGCFFSPTGSVEGDSADATSDAATSDAATTTDKPLSCGDLVVDPGEECDAGPDGNGACTDACTLNYCGDGYTGSGEGCDDGNKKPGDGCTSACTLESCGDGNLQAGEGCDDGNQNPTDACTNLCQKPACGDGFLYVGFEECDDGNDSNDDACTVACTESRCGDGFVGPGEACDDGNDDDLDGCNSACAANYCGDGVVQEALGEACDQGGENSDAGACTEACQWAFCGDGHVHAGEEECDDGNASDEDACLTSCEEATCGDGFVGPDEECDHGPKNGLGACNALCQREGYAVFVTSQQFLAGRDFSGNTSADELCVAAAEEGLGFPGDFAAWLGDTDDTPLDNFTHGAFPYVMFGPMGYVVIADDWDDLIDGTLLEPISLDEFGETVTALDDCDPAITVWTGLANDGVMTTADCFDWESSEMSAHGEVGSAISTTLWSNNTCSQTCDVPARFYCFEQ